MSRIGPLTPLIAMVVGLAAATPVQAVDDGSPEQLFRIASPRISESSGLATSATLPGVLWTVNDSGGTAQVFGLDVSGRTVATVTLPGASNRDWEAVAVGPGPGGRSWLWVGDIGDNLSVWPSVRVYRLAEPDVPGPTAADWTAYDLAYPDGPRDAEALLVDPTDGRLYVVSKRVQGAAVYRAPVKLRAGRVNRLTRVRSAPPLVTDGAFAPDGRVALRDYLEAYVSPTLTGPRRVVGLPLLPQGESLTWTRDGSALLVGSEGEHSQVWQVPVTRPLAIGSVTSPGGAPESPPPVAAGTPSAPAAAGDTSPLLVAGAGLVVGAGLALLVGWVRRRRASATAGPRPGQAS